MTLNSASGLMKKGFRGIVKSLPAVPLELLGLVHPIAEPVCRTCPQALAFRQAQ